MWTIAILNTNDPEGQTEIIIIDGGRWDTEVMNYHFPKETYMHTAFKRLEPHMKNCSNYNIETFSSQFESAYVPEYLQRNPFPKLFF